MPDIAFAFHPGHDRAVPSSAKVVDTLIAAASGAALPGPLGLAQACVLAWTQPMSGPGWLRTVRASLMTVGAVRAYLRDRDPGRDDEYEDKSVKYMEAHGLLPVPALERVRSPAYSYLRRAEPFEDRAIPQSDRIVRRFRCGLTAIFYDARDVERCDRGQQPPWLLVCRPKDVPEIITAVREAIWTTVGGDIDFYARDQRNAPPSYHFGRLPDIGDYVDRPDNGHAPLLASMAHRAQLFLAKQIPRRILFYGPPGTGKTTLARQLAIMAGQGRALRMDPRAISLVGNQQLADMVGLLQPSVVLLDDMDRADGVAGLLAMVEDHRQAPLLIGTVNAVSRLDPALLRPGRFDEVIEVTAPDSHWLAEIIKHYAESFGLDPSIDLAHLGELALDFTPAEVRELIQVCSIVGPEVLEVEAARLRRQREHYADDRVARHLHHVRTVDANSRQSGD